MGQEMERMSGRILAISWAMPPLVVPRSINVSRTLKVLKNMGWEIDILAGELPFSEASSFQYDHALAKMYNDVYTLHKVAYGDKPRGYWRQLIQKLGIGRKQVTWPEAASVVACRLIAERRPDLLVTFAQPFSDHLIGLDLKKRFPDLPWIAHCSDPWVDNPYMNPTQADRIHEREMMEQAAAVVFTTPRTAKLVLRKYPGHFAGKVHVVPHGYDELYNITNNIPAPDQPLRILHTGDLYGLRKPWALLDALANLCRNEKRKLELRFIGRVDEKFKNKAYELDLGSIIAFDPPTTPDVCRKAAQHAHVLLLCDAPAAESVFLPSKLVDYLAFGLPILALTPEEGASADVLQEVNGMIVSPDNQASITAALEELLDRYDRKQLHELVPCPVAVKRFSITETTRLFDDILRQHIHR